MTEKIGQTLVTIIAHLVVHTVELFFLALSLTTLWVNAQILRETWLATQSAHWPSTTGLLQERSPLYRSGSRWYVDVTYTYERAGGTYHGQQICWLEMLFGCHMDMLNDLVDNHQKQDPIQIYPHPTQPDTAVLYQTPRIQFLGLLCAFPIIWLGSYFLLIPGYAVLKTRYEQLQKRFHHPLSQKDL